MYRRARRGKGGFTLIEMIVSVAIFSIVMLIAGATLLSLVYANRKAQALQSVINNLNVSLDGMVRAIREGENYRCGGETSTFGDCTGGGSIIYFTPFGKPADGQNGNPQDDIAYAACAFSGTVWSPIMTVAGEQTVTNMRVCEDDLNQGWVPITSSEVQIQSFTMYVVGTKPASLGGTQQSKVVFFIKGQAGAQASTISTFDIQATAVQRILNL